MDKTTTDQISCDTEHTEEQKFSDLETEVEHSDISASTTSDVLPEYLKPLIKSGCIKVFTQTLNMDVE